MTKQPQWLDNAVFYEIYPQSFNDTNSDGIGSFCFGLNAFAPYSGAELAHEHGMLVLADEAHGTHLYFGEGLPCSAMAAGADMAAVSHRSLTDSFSTWGLTL